MYAEYCNICNQCTVQFHRRHLPGCRSTAAASSVETYGSYGCPPRASRSGVFNSKYLHAIVFKCQIRREQTKYLVSARLHNTEMKLTGRYSTPRTLTSLRGCCGNRGNVARNLAQNQSLLCFGPPTVARQNFHCCQVCHLRSSLRKHEGC